MSGRDPGEKSRDFYVAVAGARSFIAKGIISVATTTIGLRVGTVPKDSLATENLSPIDCLYLVLGRSKGTDLDRLKEKQDILAYLHNPTKPRRTVYISSMDYQGHKLECERMLREGLPAGHDLTVIRPPAVFGPGQSIDSPMLIPSLVREGGKTQLKTAGMQTKFISLTRLCSHLIRFADPDYVDHLHRGQPHGDFATNPISVYEMDGTLTATPEQIRDLFDAFRGLQAEADWTPCGACGNRHYGMC